MDKESEEKVTPIRPLSGGKTTGTVEDFIDHDTEKKIIRKIDLNLITLFGCLYLMSFLDRSNIGNANLTSFSKDLNLVDNQYGAAVSVVYATYVVFEPFWNVMFKILTPKLLMTGSCVAWSALTIGTAFAKNFDQLVGIRVLLGAAEAAIIPCVLMYVTMTYNRDEYAVRQTYIFTFSAISGAFGGLLAYGLTQISTGGLHGWQWMYLVEGIISFCLVPITLLWLPNSINEARWLKPHEKTIMAKRLERNKGQYDAEEHFTWSEIIRSLKDPKLYIQSISHFGIDTTLYAVTTFMPKIIAGLGFTTTVNAQLLTIPVYFVAALSYLILGWLSDRTKMRSPFLFGSLCSCLIGYIVLAVPSSPVGVRYFGVFLVAAGLYSTTSLNLVWAACNHSGYFKRAFTTGVIQLVGNSAGAAIGFIFKAQTAPRYLEGMHFAIGMTLMSMVLTGLNLWFVVQGNKKKRKAIAEGAVDAPKLGDRNPHFLLYL
ncbi:major facilitator superfamily domain-containing protein [Lophiotrema nucula]|uniref:Major facilitator superfamily domain-containing protein n=1 Tax=Lophiotrema nucula TaxID=690887 RepID=A0A6A5YZC3_9PLEO|nr:major facilitator superfamily domain-containing protein [Lophiotrema nucula]